MPIGVDGEPYTWDYRVVEVDHERGAWFRIHTVFYRPDGSIKYFSTFAEPAFGDTPDELQGDLLAMLEALDKPILKLSYLKSLFPGGCPPKDGQGFTIIYDEADIPDRFNSEAEEAAYWDTHSWSEEALERAAHQPPEPALTALGEERQRLDRTRE